MPLYWRIQSLPELSHLSDDERKILYRECITWRTTSALIRRGFLVGFLFAGLTAALTYRWLPTTQLQTTFILSALILGFCIGYQRAIRAIRTQMRLAIVRGQRGQRLPVCLKCGYDLKGIEGNVCPECGHGIMVKEKPPQEK